MHSCQVDVFADGEVLKASASCTITIRLLHFVRLLQQKTDLQDWLFAEVAAFNRNGQNFRWQDYKIGDIRKRADVPNGLELVFSSAITALAFDVS